MNRPLHGWNWDPNAALYEPRPDCLCGHAWGRHGLTGTGRCLHGDEGRRFSGGHDHGAFGCACPAYRPSAPARPSRPVEHDAAAVLGATTLGSLAGSLVGGFVGSVLASGRDEDREREVEALRSVAAEARAVLDREAARARHDKGVPRHWFAQLVKALDRLDAARSAIAKAAAPGGDVGATSAKTQSGRNGDGPRPVTTRAVEATKRR